MASPSSTVQLHVGAPALSSHPVSVRNPAGISIHESTRQELRPLLPRARLGAVAPDSARADSTGPPRARRRFRRRLRLDEASIESLIQESATRGKGRDRASRKSLRGSGGHSFVGGELPAYDDVSAPLRADLPNRRRIKLALRIQGVAVATVQLQNVSERSRAMLPSARIHTKTNIKGIGHSSWVLAQRPSTGVMLNPYGEPRDGAQNTWSRIGTSSCILENMPSR